VAEQGDECCPPAGVLSQYTDDIYGVSTSCSGIRAYVIQKVYDLNLKSQHKFARIYL